MEDDDEDDALLTRSYLDSSSGSPYVISSFQSSPSSPLKKSTPSSSFSPAYSASPLKRAQSTLGSGSTPSFTSTSTYSSSVPQSPLRRSQSTMGPSTPSSRSYDPSISPPHLSPSYLPYLLPLSPFSSSMFSTHNFIQNKSTSSNVSCFPKQSR